MIRYQKWYLVEANWYRSAFRRRIRSGDGKYFVVKEIPLVLNRMTRRVIDQHSLNEHTEHPQKRLRTRSEDSRHGYSGRKPTAAQFTM